MIKKDDSLLSTWNNAFSLLLEAKKAWEVHSENWRINRHSIEELPLEAQRFLSHSTNGSTFEIMLDRFIPHAKVAYGGIENLLIPVEEKVEPKTKKGVGDGKD